MKETNFNYENSFGLQASAIFSAGKWLNGNVFAVGIYKHAKMTISSICHSTARN